MTQYERIVAVDVGTTCIRACVYNNMAKLEFSFEKPVDLMYDQNSDHSLCAEMDPEKTWDDFVDVVREAVRFIDGKTFALAICTQRNTFVSWNRETLEPCHRLITWKDGRANNACTDWNHSWCVKVGPRSVALLQGINWGGWLGAHFTRSSRFKAASVFKFLNAMVSHRFLVTLESDEQMQELLKQGRLCLGCVESWLVAKLSGGRLHVSEPSSASSTGLYDPFTADWGTTLLRMIGFPVKVLPTLTKSADKCIAKVSSDVFGQETAVVCLAAIPGSGVVDNQLVKVSLGTGTFVNVLTDKPHPTLNGVYPLVAWSTSRIQFTVEARSNDTATCLRWARDFGLFDDIDELNEFKSGEMDPGLHFVPAFSGIQTPIDDSNACAGFLGLRPTTTRRELLYAVICSISFRVRHIWDTLRSDIGCFSPKAIRLCGGVANNPVICQQVADLTNTTVERVAQPEFASAKGVCLLAGVACGWWTEKEMGRFVDLDATIKPGQDTIVLSKQYTQWLRAVRRCSKF